MPNLLYLLMLIQKLKQNKSFPIFVLILLSMIWGSSFILIKKGLIAFSPLQVGTLRIIFAGIVLLPFALKNIKKNLKSHWKKFLLIGLISNLIPAILYATAETELSSSLTGMLTALTPVMTTIIGILFYKSKISLPITLSLVIGFSGSLVLSFVSGTGELGAFNYYALFVILATLLYGISGNMIKDFVHTFNPVTLAALVTLLTLPLSLAILSTTDFTTRIVSHPDAILSLLSIFILGALGSGFAVTIFNKLIKMTSAVFASSVTYIIPIVAIGWGIFDGETLFPLHFLGMGLIIIGIVILNKYK